jgi:hypothetical protein
MITLMPAPWQVSNGLVHAFTGRVDNAHQTAETQCLLLGFPGAALGQRTGRQGDDAQALRRHLVLGLQDAVAGGGIQFADSAREMDRSTQRQHALKRPLQ